MLIQARAAAAAKQADADRKKAEKEALLAAELASLPDKKSKSKTAPPKPSSKLDLASLDAPTPTSTTSDPFSPAAQASRLAALNATGIDNALDALSITGSSNDTKVDKHPERRFAAAYRVFEERRLEEMKDEKGLRRQQKQTQIRKEFQSHPDNPFNQVTAEYNADSEAVRAIRTDEMTRREDLLAEK